MHPDTDVVELKMRTRHRTSVPLLHFFLFIGLVVITLKVIKVRYPGSPKVDTFTKLHTFHLGLKSRRFSCCNLVATGRIFHTLKINLQFSALTFLCNGCHLEIKLVYIHL